MLTLLLSALQSASCCWRHEIFRVQATKIPYSAGKPLPPAGHLLGSKLSSLNLFPSPSALHDLQPASEPLQTSSQCADRCENFVGRPFFAPALLESRVSLPRVSASFSLSQHSAAHPRHPNDMTRLPSPHNTMPQRIPDHRLHT